MDSSAIPNKTLVTIKYFWESVRLSNKSHYIPNKCFTYLLYYKKFIADISDVLF